MKENKKDNNEQYDGDWIEVGAKKSSRTQIKVTAAPLPNDNTYILLSDDHGPRKQKQRNNPETVRQATIQHHPLNERIPYQRDHSAKRKSKVKN